MTVTSEYLVYDLADLAGDIGGIMGMLLGASLLTWYDWVTARAKKWFNSLTEGSMG